MIINYSVCTLNLLCTTDQRVCITKYHLHFFSLYNEYRLTDILGLYKSVLRRKSNPVFTSKIREIIYYWALSFSLRTFVRSLLLPKKQKITFQSEKRNIIIKNNIKSNIIGNERKLIFHMFYIFISVVEFTIARTTQIAAWNRKRHEFTI